MVELWTENPQTEVRFLPLALASGSLMVERSAHDGCDAGSTPVRKNGRMAEWSIAVVLKTTGCVPEGSNPSTPWLRGEMVDTLHLGCKRCGFESRRGQNGGRWQSGQMRGLAKPFTKVAGVRIPSCLRWQLAFRKLNVRCSTDLRELHLASLTALVRCRR